MSIEARITTPFGSIMRHAFRLSFVLLSGLVLLLSAFEVRSADYYVASDGNDANNCTSASTPCKTISKAATKVTAGDTVYIRGGIYHEAVNISANGTAAQPITFTNYNGEKPIVDGTGSNGIRYRIPKRQNGGALVEMEGDYIVVRNLTVRYSGDRGFSLLGRHDIVENCYVYECWGSGIFMNNYYNTAQGNRVRSCSMKYYYYLYPDPHYPGYWNWSTGITCARYPMYGTIRDNISYDNWGHGISTYESEYTTIEGNIAYNNTHLNFYVSDAKYILTKNNLSYCTPGNDRKAPTEGFQYGIYTGDELGHPDPFPDGTGRVPSSDNTFVNNFSMGCDKPFSIKTGISNNSLFAYNTLVNAVAGGDADLELRSGSCTNCRFINNIVVQKDSVPIAVNDGSGMYFSNNLWSRTPPAYFRSSTDVIGDPLLAKTGSFAKGQLTGEWFKLTSNSPAIDEGTSLANVNEDFFGTTRPLGPAPDIGGHEYYPPDLVIQGGGNGSGTVSGDGITCSVIDGIAEGDCIETILKKTPITLTATPDPGSVFVGWTGGGCPATGPCDPVFTRDGTVTATFSDVTTFTKVTMVSPNGKERLPSGGSWDLIWGGPPEVTSYKLMYSLDNGITWNPITTVTGTTTSWTLPTVKKNTTTCLTKVMGYNGTTKVGADISNKPFTVEVVRLTYPNGGELPFGPPPFSSGQDITIAWTTHGTVNPVYQVQLFYTLDNGVTWKAFALQPDPGSDPGSYTVQLPTVDKTKSNCKVKVVLKDVNGKKLGSDVSDRVFTISP